MKVVLGIIIFLVIIYYINKKIHIKEIEKIRKAPKCEKCGKPMSLASDKSENEIWICKHCN